VGTAAPAAKLDVSVAGGMVRVGSASGNNLIQAYNDSCGGGIWAGGQTRLYSTGDMTLSVGAALTTAAPTGYTDALTITSTGNGGNVGIGEVSPQGALQITRTTDHANFVLRSDLGAGGGYGGFIRGRSEAFQGGQLDLGTLEANVGFVRMSISHQGYVGIGTTGPSYQLQLSTDSAAKPSTNTWTIASDVRIKTETGEYTKGLDAVLALRPVTYRYNGKAGMIDDGEDKISIIAQEAITAFPECVGSYMVKLEEDDEEETEVLNWNGHALTFALVNSIKELAARLEALENN
jgi:trimeric autotransporter adhesin